MKVILTAFDGLMKSDVMEWPELPPGRELDYPLKQIRHNFFGYFPNDEDPAFPAVNLRATFKHTGRTFEQENGSLALEYELIRVNPKHWDDGGKEEKERDLLLMKLALQKAMEITQDAEEAEKVAKDWGLVEGEE